MENYHHVPSRPAIVPSLGGMQSWHDSWNLFSTSGSVFDSPRAVIDSSSTPFQGMLHSLTQSVTFEHPVRESAGKPVARGGERNQETIPTPRFARRPSTMSSFFPAEGVFPQNHKADQDHRFRNFSDQLQVRSCRFSMCWMRELRPRHI